MRAYHETFGLPTLISCCSNNYGFNQYPEKLIPLTISNAIAGKALPIYGDGKNIRDWLFVGDHCEAILAILYRGRVGHRYNVGGRNERTNLEVVTEVCAALEELLPAESNAALAAKGCKSYPDLITLVPDRPGHDRRYAIDCSRIEQELGWTSRISFEMGLRVTVRWYLLNRSWCQAVQRDTTMVEDSASPSPRRGKIDLGTIGQYHERTFMSMNLETEPQSHNNHGSAYVEGNYTGWWLGNPALPGDAGDLEATRASLRQTHDLLSPGHADDGGDTRYSGDKHAARAGMFQASSRRRFGLGRPIRVRSAAQA